MVRRLASVLAVVLVVFAAACGSGETAAPAQGGVRTVAAADAAALIGTGVTVIDVRTPEEFDTSHVAGARNIPVESPDFAERVGALDRSGSYVVYCRSGRRSAIAAAAMGDLGFADVADAGAIEALRSAGVALE